MLLFAAEGVAEETRFAERGWFVRRGSSPLIRRLRRQLPPQGGSLWGEAPVLCPIGSLPLARGRCPEGADEVEAVPLHRGECSLSTAKMAALQKAQNGRGLGEEGWFVREGKLSPHPSPAATASPQGGSLWGSRPVL